MSNKVIALEAQTMRPFVVLYIIPPYDGLNAMQMIDEVTTAVTGTMNALAPWS